ncbi:uncharacterized protein [Mycetomoellerius zeteki]|uniref:uncharacterized protein n=1 Tax=Mycetomoellerius zeteki TaxID=64791 RepID=UPI00084EC174|nr:PREDICTED: uncharacterized protein LOC108722324 [Trachymyrmex zeteki]
MKFLDDTIEKPCTVTSLSADVDECSMQPKTNTTQTIPTPQTSDSISSDSWVNISDKSNDDTFSCKTQSSKKRKKKEHDDSSDIEITKAILSSIQESKNTPDAVDGFFLQIGNRLRALPQRERIKFEIKILTDLYELENSLH